jgi:hypothetical protein
MIVLGFPLVHQAIRFGRLRLRQLRGLWQALIRQVGGIYGHRLARFQERVYCTQFAMQMQLRPG